MSKAVREAAALGHIALDEVERLQSAIRAIELAVDGLNTKAFKQKPETQAVLDRIKFISRKALSP